MLCIYDYECTITAWEIGERYTKDNSLEPVEMTVLGLCKMVEELKAEVKELRRGK